VIFTFKNTHLQIKNYLKIIVVVNISYTYINIKAVTLTSGNTKKEFHATVNADGRQGQDIKERF